MSNGRDVRSTRIAKGLRLKDLAKLARVPLSKLSKYERGLVEPDDEFLVALSRVLDVSSEQLREAQLELYQNAIPGEGYTTGSATANYIMQRRDRLNQSIIPIIDLFCGVGGFSHGFEQAGRFKTTIGVDFLPDRVETFSTNHSTATAFCNDMRQLRIDTLVEAGPRPQVVIGGPPCQGFSSIRPFRTLTEKDARNNLFEHFALVINAFRPEWFVLENVVGLISHSKGRTLQAILKLFEQVGYKANWAVLNAAHYGLPQRRERLFIVGNLKGKTFRWPEPSHYSNGRSMAGRLYNHEIQQLSLLQRNSQPAVTVMEAIHDLPPIEAGASANWYRDDITPTEYEKGMRGCEQILTLHEATKHSPQMIEIIRQAGHNRNVLPEGLTTSGFSSSYSRLEPDLPSVTLTVNFVHPSSNKCIHPYQDRALTPREGARLQGFEDSYRFIGTRSQMVKQIGNAVPPIMGKVIAEALLEQW
jgi:DNA (cytosine-5)-methyltransferase 1